MKIEIEYVDTSEAIKQEPNFGKKLRMFFFPEEDEINTVVATAKVDEDGLEAEAPKPKRGRKPGARPVGRPRKVKPEDLEEPEEPEVVGKLRKIPKPDPKPILINFFGHGEEPEPEPEPAAEPEKAKKQKKVKEPKLPKQTKQPKQPKPQKVYAEKPEERVIKIRIPRVMRKVFATACVLVVLFEAVGISYTWYMGRDSNIDTAAVAAPVESKPEPVIRPTAPAANAKVSASVQMVTSPVQAGSDASIGVKTTAGSTCKIAVVYGEAPTPTVTSTDKHLTPQVADDFGYVGWDWTIEKTAPLGKGKATVTCARGTQSGVVVADVVVAP